MAKLNNRLMTQMSLRGVAQFAWRVSRYPRRWTLAVLLGVRFIVMHASLPRILLYFGLAPGDDLLCTAVLRELRKRDQRDLVMISGHPEIFHGSNDALCVLSPGKKRSYIAIYEQFARTWHARFKRINYAPFDGFDQSEMPSHHIIAEMCAGVGITGRINARPYLALTEDEKARTSWAKDCIAIQSSGMGGRLPMKNKQWYAERFQGVVDELRGESEFVQLGSAEDPSLDQVEDLRGHTAIRETAAILYHARLYVGTVGFLMHLARAVECPSVIVYGGREAPWQSGYICNKNLFTPLPCAPCWRWNSCDFDRLCMREITVSHVVSAIREMISKPRAPLAVETIEIL